MANKLKIKYFRSSIGREQSQKDTVRKLGFTKLNQVREIADQPSVRGMINKVQHMVKIVQG